MSAPNDDEDAALQARLEKLKGELKANQPKPPPSTAPIPVPGGATGAAMSMGMKAGSEFVGAVVVGGAIGWGLDWLLHTKPTFTIIFFLFGVAAGVYGVIRTTSPKSGDSRP
jgi:ATP synthase protein I